MVIRRQRTKVLPFEPTSWARPTNTLAACKTLAICKQASQHRLRCSLAYIQLVFLISWLLRCRRISGFTTKSARIAAAATAAADEPHAVEQKNMDIEDLKPRT